MKRFIASTLIALSALVGCASTNPEPPKLTPPSPEVVRMVHPPAVLSPQTVDHKNWRATLPPGWEVVPQPPVDHPGLKLEYAARSPEKVGKFFVAFTVASMPLEGVPAQNFGPLATMSMRGSDGMHVQGSKLISVGEQLATLNIVSTDQGLLNAIIAVGSDEADVGYVVSCGGDIEEVVPVRDACVPILKSFELVSAAPNAPAQK